MIVYKTNYRSLEETFKRMNQDVSSFFSEELVKKELRRLYRNYEFFKVLKKSVLESSQKTGFHNVMKHNFKTMFRELNEMIEAGKPTCQHLPSGKDSYSVFNQYLYASIKIQHFPEDPKREPEIVGTIGILPANALV